MLGRFGRSLKAAQELGLKQSSQYLLYRFGLLTGHYRRILQAIAKSNNIPGQFMPVFHPARPELLSSILKDHQSSILSEADLILSGSFHPFGADPTPLDLTFPNSDLIWTDWKFPTDLPASDIKDIWEPNRFGWAVPLARAYHLTKEPRYVDCFWERVQEFSRLNPPYMGPNWQSAQEVGLRLIHWVACAGEFLDAGSSTNERITLLTHQIQLHAERIPVTMVYAKAQNNNHWLSEAAGLFTAGCTLLNHPFARRWRKDGWREFEAAILQQISDDGTYIQHSVCYHRLMLTLALWMNAISGEFQWSQPVRRKLALAARWLDEIIANPTGEAPNLGSNDGSLILPFTSDPVTSFRDIADAAMRAFCQEDRANISEMSAWLVPAMKELPMEQSRRQPPFSVQKLSSRTSIGFLRTAWYNGRPSQADQLHMDLWWEGENILRDAGTFRYNASPPWENTLAGTEVHNTLGLDGKDQMTRAGKFLWVSWAQGEASESLRIGDGWRGITASHDGYQAKGIIHQRTVEWNPYDTWVIRDKLISTGVGKKRHQVRLQWLLPDAFPPGVSAEGGWQWAQTANSVVLTRGEKIVAMNFALQPDDSPIEICLYQAGECLVGTHPAQPTWGWYSPTYGVKQPALSVAVYADIKATVTLITEIHLTYVPLSNLEKVN